jgi:hypothetical protein
MKKLILSSSCLFAVATLFAQQPASPKKPVTDTYFNWKVTDNYRWLEDTKDTAVKTWLKAQADYTNAQLNKIPGRDSLIKTFQQYNMLKPYNITDVVKKGGRYFLKKHYRQKTLENFTTKQVLMVKRSCFTRRKPSEVKPMPSIISCQVRMVKN